MLKVGKLINIEVIDHLVISEEKFTSFEDDGIMAEIKEWKLEIERDRAVKANKIDIGKKMKKDGLDEDTIKKYTGLNLHTIRSL